MRLQRQCSHFGERSAVCPEDRALTQVWTLPSRLVSVFSQTAHLVPDKPHRIAWPSCLIDKLPTSEHENQLHTVLCQSFQAWRTRQNEVIIKVCDCGQQMKSLDSNPIKHPRQSKKPVKAMAMDCTKRAASSVYRSGHYQSPNVNAEQLKFQCSLLKGACLSALLRSYVFPSSSPDCLPFEQNWKYLRSTEEKVSTTCKSILLKVEQLSLTPLAEIISHPRLCPLNQWVLTCFLQQLSIKIPTPSRHR